MEGLGKIFAAVALLGVGVALAIPKVRKRIRENLAAIAENTRRGYKEAVGKINNKRVVNEDADEEVIAKAKRAKIKKISMIKMKAKRAVSKEKMPEAQGANVNPEVEENIIKTLKENPSGKSLTDLGSALNTHFIRLAAPIKRLVEQGKVRKEEKLYFAAA